jgi:hypothetical protein
VKALQEESSKAFYSLCKDSELSINLDKHVVMIIWGSTEKTECNNHEI